MSLKILPKKSKPPPVPWMAENLDALLAQQVRLGWIVKLDNYGYKTGWTCEIKWPCFGPKKKEPWPPESKLNVYVHGAASPFEALRDAVAKLDPLVREYHAANPAKPKAPSLKVVPAPSAAVKEEK